VYEDAAHAFFNDTGARYDPDAAADAWQRVTEFFAARL
jgi:carboxymethylenebutenolidase